MSYATNAEQRVSKIEAFERSLAHRGWTRDRRRWCWHHIDICLEMDDVGFWLWRSGVRVTGMAWDSLRPQKKYKMLTFTNGIVLEI